MNRLQEFRKAIGLTQARLASLSGLSQATICDIENGNSDPSINRAQNIIGALRSAGSDATLETAFPAEGSSLAPDAA